LQDFSAFRSCPVRLDTPRRADPRGPGDQSRAHAVRDRRALCAFRTGADTVGLAPVARAPWTAAAGRGTPAAVNVAPRGASPVPEGPDERRALDFLAELIQALALSTDLRKTLPMALGRIADFMQAEAASLFLVDPVSGLIECRLCVGPVDIVGLKLEVGQ